MRNRLDARPMFRLRLSGSTVIVVVLRPWFDGNGGTGTSLYMWCPGCEDVHAVEVAEPASRWEWDGNLDAPTISPSIKVTGVQWDADISFHKPRHAVATGGQTICHSFVKQGHWEFLSDCTHVLVGQTVPMVAVPDWLIREGLEPPLAD